MAVRITEALEKFLERPEAPSDMGKSFPAGRGQIFEEEIKAGQADGRTSNSTNSQTVTGAGLEDK